MFITDKIHQLKKEKNAVILAHYYVRPEIQAIADYIGDSYYLSKIAVDLKEQVIVFCGVSFMGESAKLLNPEKTILMPDMDADCEMAHMACEASIRKMREQYADLAVVCYVNSTVKLKALSDVCVTSANAVKIVKALPNKNIYFIPDRNLAHFVASQVPDKNFIFNDGYCPIHEKICINEIIEVQQQYPDALVLAHPECPKALLDLADYVGSTSGILAYAKQSTNQSFIICTESGVRYKLEQENPEKQFYFTKTEPICKDMKRITLSQILHVLQTGEHALHLDAFCMERAKKPLERMLMLSK